jgi:DNA-3-methyladenine glycosylase II
MYARLSKAITPFTPERFLALGENYLRSLGLTRQKSAYCLELSRSLVERRMKLRSLARMSDEDAGAMLMSHKGIGNWSANIYLLMALRRPDIWPSGDVALVTTVTELKQLSKRPNADELLEMAENWRPFRAVAARLLWQYYLAKRGRL